MTSGFLGIVFNMIRMVFGKQGAAAHSRAARSAQPSRPSAPPPPGMGTVSFTQQGPSGQVIYTSAESRFSLYWEYGGGDVLVTISVPQEAEWEAYTKIPVAKRLDILNYIGREAIRQNNGGKGSFEVDGGWLVVRG